MLRNITLNGLVMAASVLLLLGCEPSLIDERYLENGDGTITDTKTNLTWRRCSVGQDWTGRTCVGKAEELLWEQAMQQVKDDWRLPTVDELETLVYCSTERKPSVRPEGQYDESTVGECVGDYIQPTINKLAFPETPENSFWSSSSYIGYIGYRDGVWYVSFYDGHVGHGPGDYHELQVRLVREGQ